MRYVFQSTRPRGARPPSPSGSSACATRFNPRARVGRDPPGAARPSPGRCFNPRARVGRDHDSPPPAVCVDGFNPRARVGRDMRPVPGTGDVGRFQSTRPRGARPLLVNSRTHRNEFQSTRPRGARRGQGSGDDRHCVVSIHAPAWGATVLDSGLGWVERGFNPRARVGRDEVSPVAPKPGATFQSTRPRGARRSKYAMDFPERGVSIHAPAWGATVSS